MKTELMIFAVLAMVVSSFLNAEIDTTSDVAATKLRIENAGEIYVKSQQIETVSTVNDVVKPNEG